MNQTQEYLKYLLGRKEWTMAEKEWMLHYLEGDDLTDLEAVAFGEFNSDLAGMKKILDRKLSENVLEKIHQRIQPAPALVVEKPRLRWLKWAAAALIIIMAGAAYYMLDIAGNAGLQYNQLATTLSHELKTVKLPDGSTVNLQPGSSLHYPDRFQGETRNVKLSGEAFFDVIKNPSQPFVVHTELVRTTVLGTSFNIEANGADSVSVVVVTGSVKVATANGKEDHEEIVLQTKQGVEYDRLSNKMEIKQAFEEAHYLEQRQKGKFEYNGDAVKKVIADIERFYNTSVTLRDELQRCVFYGHINTSDDLDKALRLISASLGATVARDSTAGNYIISGGSCQ